MTNKHPLKPLSDDALLRRLSELVHGSRRVEVEVIAHIAEVDARRLYAREAASSMFVYCTDVLHLSEHEAYLRIRVARAASEHPVLLDMLADGRIHLSGIGTLVPHLTPGNRDSLLERATHRSKRQIEELIAELRPQPDVLATVRKLPVRASTLRHSDAVKPRPAEPTALELGPERVAESAAAGRSTRASRAPRTRALQGPVHGERRAARQAGAAATADAAFGTQWGSGRDHRAGREREAGAARGEALRQDEGAAKDAGEDGHLGPFTPHPGSGAP